MAQVPIQTIPTQELAAGQMNQYSAPGVEPMQDVVSKNIQDLGKTQVAAGITMIKIQDEMDDAAAKAADVKFVTETQRILTNPDNGYLFTSGVNAKDAYLPTAEAIAKVKEEAGANLTNNTQKTLFESTAAKHMLTYQTQMNQHAVKQVQTYALKEADARATTYAGLAANTFGTKEFEVYKNTALNEVDAAADLLKWPADSAQRQKAKQDTLNTIYGNVITGMLEKGDVEAARGLMAKHGKEMDPSSIIRFDKIIREEGGLRQGKFAARETADVYRSTFNPTQEELLDNIQFGVESGGKHYNAKGELITSDKGAQGISQVMPKTGTSPGYGVEPLKDQSVEEYRRFGRDYRNAMLKEYGGSLPLALAAYNYGPGNLNAALAAAKKNDEDVFGLNSKTGKPYLPKETRDYVDVISSQFAAGGGKPALPSRMQYVDSAVNRAGNDPIAREAARLEATKNYDIAVYAQKNREAEIVGGAYMELVKNGGNYDSLPLNLRTSIPPSMVPAVQKFAENQANGINETDKVTYFETVGDPAKLKNMSRAELNMLRPKFSKEDFAYAENFWGKLQTGSADNKVLDVNDQALKPILENRLTSIMPKWEEDTKGKGKDPKVVGRVGAIQQYINTSIIREQAQIGRQLTPDELRKVVDNTFAKDATFQKTFMGFTGAVYKEKVMEMSSSDIPDAQLKSIRDAYKQRGIENPTEQDILGVYWTMRDVASFTGSSVAQLSNPAQFPKRK